MAPDPAKNALVRKRWLTNIVRVLSRLWRVASASTSRGQQAACGHIGQEGTRTSSGRETPDAAADGRTSETPLGETPTATHDKAVELSPLAVAGLVEDITQSATDAERAESGPEADEAGERRDVEEESAAPAAEPAALQVNAKRRGVTTVREGAPPLPLALDQGAISEPLVLETPGSRLLSEHLQSTASQEADQPSVDAERKPPSGDQKGLAVAPEKRGGRRRGASVSEQRPAYAGGERREKARQQRPELVCWFQGMARGWAVGVEVPEDLRIQRLQVRQPPACMLEEEGARSGRLRLKEPLAPVEFVATEPSEKSVLRTEIPAAPFRIFKLGGSHAERGRAMYQGSTGHVLVVVPKSWRWNEELSGPAPANPEYVFPGTCRAYRVELPLPGGYTLAFATADGDCVRIPCSGERFQLVGKTVRDACTDAGPLFVSEPPELRVLTDPGAETVVVGEEGPAHGRRRWRVYGQQFEEVRQAVAGRRAGWFFVRLYDDRDQLVDSLDFRFVAELEAIEIQAASPAPGPNGHSAARIHFRHGPECSVRCCSAKPLTTNPELDGSSAIVPPDPQFDETPLAD